MATKDEVFDYVMDTPENTNPGVLRSLLDNLPEGTDVEANPELEGTEDSLTGLKVGDTKYKVEGGLTQATADSRYLQLSGGTMTGNISLNSNAIVQDSLNMIRYGDGGIVIGGDSKIIIDSSEGQDIRHREGNATRYILDEFNTYANPDFTNQSVGFNFDPIMQLALGQHSHTLSNSYTTPINIIAVKTKNGYRSGVIDNGHYELIDENTILEIDLEDYFASEFLPAVYIPSAEEGFVLMGASVEIFGSEFTKTMYFTYSEDQWWGHDNTPSSFNYENFEKEIKLYGKLEFGFHNEDECQDYSVVKYFAIPEIALVRYSSIQQY